MNEGTELQILLVGSSARQYSAAAVLLRSAGYVLLKCTASEVADRTRSFRADAIVVDADMGETFQVLGALPASVDPATVLVICGAPETVARTRRGVASLARTNLSDSLIQALDGMLARRMFTEPARLDYDFAGAQLPMAS